MQSISHFLHPHHVSLVDMDSVRAHLMTHSGDPFYGIDGLPSSRHLAAPKFDIVETHDAFILTGELPGVTRLKDVGIEWLDSQILLVKGQVDPLEVGAVNWAGGQKETSAEAKKERGEAGKQANGHGTGHGIGVASVKKLLGERHCGGFERSFTLPVKVDSGSAQVHLENGLLRIVVQK